MAWLAASPQPAPPSWPIAGVVEIQQCVWSDLPALHETAFGRSFCLDAWVRRAIRPSRPNMPASSAAAKSPAGSSPARVDCRVLRLEPHLRWPAAIGRVRLLRHDAFQPHAADVIEHGRAVTCEKLVQQRYAPCSLTPLWTSVTGC